MKKNTSKKSKETLNNPMVSIIITTHKRINLFKEALFSALNQDYKNKEIIVINDNDNNSVEEQYVSSLLADFPDVIYHKNGKCIGAALSRNKGVKLSHGSLIAFLDDDDVFFSNKIKEQVNLYNKLDNKNIGLIYCDVQDVELDGTFLETNHRQYEGKVLFEHMCDFVATTSTWLCPKKIFNKLGGFDNVPSQIDSLFLLKLLANGYEVYRVPKVLMYFRKNTENRISTLSDKYINELKNYHNECRKYFNLLSSSQSKIVEFYFSKKIFVYYLQLDELDNAKKVLDLMPDQIVDYITYLEYVECVDFLEYHKTHRE
jgi:glycosyltransferase involved in cell wall biosynthesis